VLVWFNKLLERSEAPVIDPLLQSEMAVCPDQVAWTMLEALAKRGMVDELNNAFKRMLLDEDIMLDPSALKQGTTVPLQGAHFTSLIHAYGCVSKDLPKAVSNLIPVLNFPTPSPTKS